jgi:hypothetical protein
VHVSNDIKVTKIVVVGKTWIAGDAAAPEFDDVEQEIFGGLGLIGF